MYRRITYDVADASRHDTACEIQDEEGVVEATTLYHLLQTYQAIPDPRCFAGSGGNMAWVAYIRFNGKNEKKCREDTHDACYARADTEVINCETVLLSQCLSQCKFGVLIDTLQQGMRLE